MAKIPIILEAGRADGKLIKTNSVYDDNQEKFLSDKIKEIDDNHNNLKDNVNTLTEIVNNNESDIENKLEIEKTRATDSENNLRETINNITEISGSATTANVVTIDTIPSTSSSNVQQALNELFENTTKEEQARMQNDQLLSQAIAAEQERAEAAEQATATAIDAAAAKNEEQDQKISELETEVGNIAIGKLIVVDCDDIRDNGWYILRDSKKLQNVSTIASLKYLGINVYPAIKGARYIVNIPKTTIGYCIAFSYYNTASSPVVEVVDTEVDAVNVSKEFVCEENYTYLLIGYNVDFGQPTLYMKDKSEIEEINDKISNIDSAVSDIEERKLLTESIGKNLFDKSSVKNGYVLTVDGAEIKVPNWGYSDYIEIEPSTKYHISWEGDGTIGYSGYYNCYYDENKTFISSLKSDIKTVTTPADAKYIRVSLYVHAPHDVQIEKGESRTYYEPYNKIGGYLEDVNNRISTLSSDVNGFTFEINLSSMRFGDHKSVLSKAKTSTSFVMSEKEDGTIIFTRSGTSSGGAGCGFYIGDICEDGEKYTLFYRIKNTAPNQVLIRQSKTIENASDALKFQMINLKGNSIKEGSVTFAHNKDYPYISTYRSFITTDGATLEFEKLELSIPMSSDNLSLLWKDKVIATYGDSITAAGNSENVNYPFDSLPACWQKIVGKYLRCAKMYNRGLGNQRYSWGIGGFSIGWADTNGYGPTNWRVDGTTVDDFDEKLESGKVAYPDGVTKELEESGERVRFRGSFCSWSRITSQFPPNIKNSIDAILVMGTTNDSIDDTDIEWIENNDTDKEWKESEYYNQYNGDYNISHVKGAIASTIMKMQAWMPNARLILMTPCSGAGTAVGQKNYSLINNEYHKSEYVRQVGKIMSIPVIDVNANVGINGLNKNDFLTDTTHPFKGAGRVRMATAIAEGLKRILPLLNE